MRVTGFDGGHFITLQKYAFCLSGYFFTVRLYVLALPAQFYHMYIPKHFTEHDVSEIEALVNGFPLATLVSVNNGLPWATHIPLQLEKGSDGTWLLHGHVSKANLQWKHFNNGTEVLAIFMGPHTYVSPSWYNHKNVPTWNYRAVHIYGTTTLVTGEALQNMLAKLMARYESEHAAEPLAYSQIPRHILEKDLHGLVAFEIKATRIEATSKLSQNRDAESYQSVIAHLKQLNAYDAAQVAAEMEKRRK